MPSRTFQSALAIVSDPRLYREHNGMSLADASLVLTPGGRPERSRKQQSKADQGCTARHSPLHRRNAAVTVSRMSRHFGKRSRP
jgi:hypothetical protein